jgi:hypothetical protein
MLWHSTPSVLICLFTQAFLSEVSILKCCRECINELNVWTSKVNHIIADRTQWCRGMCMWWEKWKRVLCLRKVWEILTVEESVFNSSTSLPGQSNVQTAMEGNLFSQWRKVLIHLCSGKELWELRVIKWIQLPRKLIHTDFWTSANFWE